MSPGCAGLGRFSARQDPVWIRSCGSNRLYPGYRKSTGQLDGDSEKEGAERPAPSWESFISRGGARGALSARHRGNPRPHGTWRRCFPDGCKSFPRQLVDQIIRKGQLFDGAVVLHKMRGAADPALPAQLAEYAADLLCIFCFGFIGTRRIIAHIPGCGK